ncbi:MAG: calcium-binding protein [Myxococcales bacterium]|nr:calcium-binding protein [Myxococcales bacterium]
MACAPSHASSQNGQPRCTVSIPRRCHPQPGSLHVRLSLSLLSTAHAACPSSFSSYDCTDKLSNALCSLSSTTYSCSAALTASTNDTQLYATADTGDATYNVYGVDSASEGFCCSVATSSVTYLIITGGAGNDNIDENNGVQADYLCGIGGGQGLTVTLYGAAGDDLIGGSGAASCATIWETLYGSPGGDIVHGHGRTVTIYGEGDSDWVLDSGDSTDSTTMSGVLHGGDGGDILESSNALGTVMHGGTGDDHFYGYDGPDEMHGGAGDDQMSGGEGDDTMWGDADRDIVAGNGDAGTDTCDLGTNLAAFPSCYTLTWLSYECGSW